VIAKRKGVAARRGLKEAWSKNASLHKVQFAESSFCLAQESTQNWIRSRVDWKAQTCTATLAIQPLH
jgi:hypothetical protein